MSKGFKDETRNSTNKHEEFHLIETNAKLTTAVIVHPTHDAGMLLTLFWAVVNKQYFQIPH
jgi:hypothetical protein